MMEVGLPDSSKRISQGLRKDGAAPYSCAVDIWSYGCMIFELLYGGSLFGGPGVTDHDIENSILDSKPMTFPAITAAGREVSPAVRAFLSAALTFIGQLRPSADALLRMEWLVYGVDDLSNAGVPATRKGPAEPAMTSASSVGSAHQPAAALLGEVQQADPHQHGKRAALAAVAPGAAKRHPAESPNTTLQFPSFGGASGASSCHHPSCEALSLDALVVKLNASKKRGAAGAQTLAGGGAAAAGREEPQAKALQAAAAEELSPAKLPQAARPPLPRSESVTNLPGGASANCRDGVSTSQMRILELQTRRPLQHGDGQTAPGVQRETADGAFERAAAATAFGPRQARHSSAVTMIAQLKATQERVQHGNASSADDSCAFTPTLIGASLARRSPTSLSSAGSSSIGELQHSSTTEDPSATSSTASDEPRLSPRKSLGGGWCGRETAGRNAVAPTPHAASIPSLLTAEVPTDAGPASRQPTPPSPSLAASVASDGPSPASRQRPPRPQKVALSRIMSLPEQISQGVAAGGDASSRGAATAPRKLQRSRSLISRLSAFFSSSSPTKTSPGGGGSTPIGGRAPDNNAQPPLPRRGSFTWLRPAARPRRNSESVAATETPSLNAE